MGTGGPSGVMGKIGLFTRHFLRGPLGSLINTAPARTAGFPFGEPRARPSPVHSALKQPMHFNAWGGWGRGAGGKKIGSTSDRRSDPEMGAKGTKRAKPEEKLDILFGESDVR